MSEQVFLPKPPENLTNHSAMTFVFCEHTVENAPRISQELTSADVVAFELVGGAPELRDRLQALSNGVTQNDLGTEAFEQSVEELEGFVASSDDEFLTVIVKALGGTGKTIHFIDADSDTNVHQSYQLALSADEQLADALQRSDLDTIKGRFADKLLIGTNIIKQREALAVKQLKAIVDKHPDDTIAVVAGAIHTAISHALSKDMPIERIFIADSNSWHQKITYSPYESALRASIFFPDKQLGDSAIKRALLEMIVLQYDKEGSQANAENALEEGLDIDIENALRAYRRHLTQERLAKIRIGRS